jgi:hypothetical protein
VITVYDQYGNPIPKVVELFEMRALSRSRSPSPYKMDMYRGDYSANNQNLQYYHQQESPESDHKQKKVKPLDDKALEELNMMREDEKDMMSHEFSEEVEDSPVKDLEEEAERQR